MDLPLTQHTVRMNSKLLNTTSKTQLVTMSNTLPKKAVVATVTMETMVMNTEMSMETSMEMRCATTPILTRTTNPLRKSVRLLDMFGWKMVTMTITASVTILLHTRIMMSTKLKRNARLQATCGWKKNMTFLKSMQISSLTHYLSQRMIMMTMTMIMMTTQMRKATMMMIMMTTQMRKDTTKLDTLSFTLRKREITGSLYLLM